MEVSSFEPKYGLVLAYVAVEDLVLFFNFLVTDRG